MNMTDRERKPHQAKPTNAAKDAWWYEDKTGISIYIYDGIVTRTCRITRRPLAAWIERTEPGYVPRVTADPA